MLYRFFDFIIKISGFNLNQVVKKVSKCYNVLMLTNYHTHTNFCDGKDSAEEIVLTAIEKGFSAIGLSGHGYTSFDLSYCMKSIPEYITEIKRLKAKYKGKIQIYLGVEEDIAEWVNRNDFDYLLGSSHYLKTPNGILPIDLGHAQFKTLLDAYNGDRLALAKTYFESFTDYILTRKPDIVGHFDLITKYDEKDGFAFLNNPEYNALAEKYLLKALESDCIFELNTGAIARGYRTSPYPSLNLLRIMQRNGAKVMINTDCHNKENLDCFIKESRKLLKDVGFEYVYVLLDGEFKKDYL